MTPIEKKEEKERLCKELAALKSLCGSMLLESNGQMNKEDFDYYIRKFNEAESNLKRIR